MLRFQKQNLSNFEFNIFWMSDNEEDDDLKQTLTTNCELFLSLNVAKLCKRN
jgi:hypothetical protein